MGNLIQHKAGFTIVSNVYCKDSSLSLAARGMIVTLLSVDAENWRFSERGLAAILPNGRASVRSAPQELEEAGYLVREQVIGDDGRFGETLYHVFEDPRKADRQTNPGYGDSALGQTKHAQNPPQASNNDMHETPPDSDSMNIEHPRRSGPWTENRTTETEPQFDFPTTENRTTNKELKNKKPSIPNHEGESLAREAEPHGVDGWNASPAAGAEGADAPAASAPSAPLPAPARPEGNRLLAECLPAGWLDRLDASARAVVTRTLAPALAKGLTPSLIRSRLSANALPPADQVRNFSGLVIHRVANALAAPREPSPQESKTKRRTEDEAFLASILDGTSSLPLGERYRRIIVLSNSDWARALPGFDDAYHRVRDEVETAREAARTRR